MIRRIIFDCVLFILLFIAPWWLALILGGIGLLFFSSFFEIIFLGIVIDSLYNAPSLKFHGVEFIVTIACVCIFAVVEFLKRHLRFYNAR